MKPPAVVGRIEAAFLVAGLLGLGYITYVVIDERAYQASEHRRLEQRRLEQPSLESPVPPATTVVPALVDGDSIGEIRIPRLGVNVMVVQGESDQILRRAVGHLAGTALPGEVGNVVLAGHRDTFFRPLKGVHAGDTITLKTRAGDFEYLVEAMVVVPPSAIEVLQPTGGRTLTLITCFPFSYLGSAPNRFIVRARQTEVDVP